MTDAFSLCRGNLRDNMKDPVFRAGIHPSEPHSHRRIWDRKAGRSIDGPVCRLESVGPGDWDWATDPVADGRSPEDAANVDYE